MSTRSPMVATELKPTNRRIEFFSDAVFGIVVTIMILELHIPDGLATDRDPEALRHFGEGLAAYALSYLVIVNLWTSHHHLLFTVTMPTRSTLWLNNLL